MMTVAIFNAKGGVGKSVLSIHIAVAATSSNRVLLLDADPQGTVAAWGSKRTNDEPMVIRANPTNIAEILRSAKNDGYTLVVVDCPPHAESGTAALLAASDHIVIPIQPAMPDLAATQRAVLLAGASNIPFSFVINRAPARAPEVAQALTALAGAGDVSPVVISDRRAFSRSLTDSLAVTELAKNRGQKAALEIIQYWNWLDQLTQQQRSQKWQPRPAV